MDQPSNQIQGIDTRSGIIAWFANNPVAANLLMVLILGFGIYSASQLKRETMPAITTNMVQVGVAYPGAAPSEVEQSILLRIEEALKDIESIERIEARAQESFANINIEIDDAFDKNVAQGEIKNAIDGIAAFPDDAEEPTIRQVQVRFPAISLQLYGDLDERSMTKLADEISLELQQNPEVGYIEVYGVRPYEIAIEIPETQLQAYGLTLGQVAEAIRRASLDLPGGAIKTANGDILLRTKAQAYRETEYEQVVLISYADGTRLTLGDIATVSDGFAEGNGFSVFNGKYSIGMMVFAVGDQDVLDVAAAARAYVDQKKLGLPEGVSFDYWADISQYVQQRLDMMTSNLAMGALLVFIMLSLFLDLKLAFWVMVGLPLCFLGAFSLLGLEVVGGSLNMFSLFGFILVLGIVVDDAIIIGESAGSFTEKHGHSTDAVVAGAKRVALPATFGVLTTIVAFLPTVMAEGVFAPMPAALGWVVIFCLAFSLVESKWILPAHIAHSRPTKSAWLKRIPEHNNRVLQQFIQSRYLPFMRRAIAHRYTTVSVFVAVMILSVGLVAGGIIRVVIIPAVPSDFIRANLEMTEGTSEEKTYEAYLHMQAALDSVNATYQAKGETLIDHSFAYAWAGRKVNFMVELTKNTERSIDSHQIARLWREAVGSIPGAKVLAITSADDEHGQALGFTLNGLSPEELDVAAEEFERKLAQYQGVYDIRNSANSNRDEIILKLKPGAETLGLSQAVMAQQVREAFYGAEAQRIQRGNSEIKVMVRYPREQRTAVSDLQSMYLRSPSGDSIPLSAAADIDVAPSSSVIHRINRERAVSIGAGVDKVIAEPGKISAQVEQKIVSELREKFPTLEYKPAGESKEIETITKSLGYGMIFAVLGIYALLAIPLKSYSQPLIIMGVIPFGMIGALFGHWLIGIPIDMMSLFGIVALSGVVVNDSLIMVDFINSARAQGANLLQAVLDSGQQRFRAIMLTSLTTFFGLSPMLMEDALQAQMLIPMAVSLSFGIIFATVITLVLIPCLYMILEDFFGDGLSSKDELKAQTDPA